MKQQQNTKPNIQIFVGTGNRGRDLSRPSRMRYLWTNESTESNDCCQAIQLFQRNVSKR